LEIATQRGVSLGDFGALRRQIRVVQFLDLLRNGQGRFAARNDFASSTSSPYSASSIRPTHGAEQRLIW